MISDTTGDTEACLHMAPFFVVVLLSSKSQLSNKINGKFSARVGSPCHDGSVSIHYRWSDSFYNKLSWLFQGVELKATNKTCWERRGCWGWSSQYQRWWQSLSRSAEEMTTSTRCCWRTSMWQLYFYASPWFYVTLSDVSVILKLLKMVQGAGSERVKGCFHSLPNILKCDD